MEINLNKIAVILAVTISWVMLGTSQLSAQQVEVQGQLKVAQMTPDDTQVDLVTRGTDGTLGTRSVASLPPPPPPIDTTRNLASDFVLAKHLCECGTNLPPFLVQSLLESGYTLEDLAGAGIDVGNSSFVCGDELIDGRDGKTYTTKMLGNQCWMTENLNVGTLIAGNVDQTDNSILEKYCYDNDESNCSTYGGLYQLGEAVQYNLVEPTQGVCPAGWHMPSDDEFKELEIQLGMTVAQADNTDYRGSNQGSQLSGNETLWADGTLDQNASFGSSEFDVLPAGSVNNGVSSDLLEKGYIWTSTGNSGAAFIRFTSFDNAGVYRAAFVATAGNSVRCIKD